MTYQGSGAVPRTGPRRQEIQLGPALAGSMGVFVHGMHAFGPHVDVRVRGRSGTVEPTS